MQEPKIVGYGVDTLVLNMSYTDVYYQPIKQELAEEIAHELEDLHSEATKNELAIISPWSFLGVSEAVCKVVLKWLDKSNEQEKRNFLSGPFLRGPRLALHTASKVAL